MHTPGSAGHWPWLIGLGLCLPLHAAAEAHLELRAGANNYLSAVPAKDLQLGGDLELRLGNTVELPALGTRLRLRPEIFVTYGAAVPLEQSIHHSIMGSALRLVVGDRFTTSYGVRLGYAVIAYDFKPRFEVERVLSGPMIGAEAGLGFSPLEGLDLNLSGGFDTLVPWPQARWLWLGLGAGLRF